MDGILTLARMLDENGRAIPLQKVVDYGFVKYGSVAPAGWGIGRDEICLGSNLVVDGGRQMMAYLLGNKSPTSDFVISTFKVGTGTTAPTVADTGLQNSVLSKAIEGVDYPSPFVLRVGMQLGPSEANGYLLTEFGLFSGNGTMIARKTQVGLSKSAGLTPVVFWRLRL